MIIAIPLVTTLQFIDIDIDIDIEQVLFIECNVSLWS